MRTVPLLALSPLVLAVVSPSLSIAQQMPQTTTAVPCCSVIGINKTTGIVTARETTTGRTFQFTASAAQLGTLTAGDPVSVDLKRGQVTALRGKTIQATPMMEPEGGVPCCAVLQFEPDAGQPCCALVSAKDNNTGEEFEFRITDADLRGAIKTGDPVYRAADASGTVSMRTTGTVKWFNDARMRSGSSGASSSSANTTYSYKVAGNQPWKMSSSADLKGAMGRLVIQDPGQGSFFLGVFKPGVEQAVAGSYGGKTFMLLPGSYDIKMAHDNSPLRVRGVPIQRGMVTRLAAGQLTLNLPGTQWAVYDEKKESVAWAGYGTLRLGLPVGTYYVEVNKEFTKVRVRDGQVTEF